jgi:hypothetical protein
LTARSGSPLLILLLSAKKVIFDIPSGGFAIAIVLVVVIVVSVDFVLNACVVCVTNSGKLSRSREGENAEKFPCHAPGYAR